MVATEHKNIYDYDSTREKDENIEGARKRLLRNASEQGIQPVAVPDLQGSWEQEGRGWRKAV